MVLVISDTAVSLAESRRAKAIRETGLTDGKARPALDRVTTLLASMFDCEIAILSFIDTDYQWILSKFDSGPSNGLRDDAFCSHVMTSAGPVLVSDATSDPDFSENPNVTGSHGIRSYLGVPLCIANGMQLGSVCVASSKKNFFSRDQIAKLDLVATIASDLINAQIGEEKSRLAKHELDRKNSRILAQNRLLENAEALAEIGSWDVTADLQTLKWSKQTYAMHEVTQGEPIKVAEAINYYAEEDRERVSGFLYDMLTEKRGAEFEATIVTASGVRKRVHCKGEFITGSRWVEDRVVGVIKEID